MSIQEKVKLEVRWQVEKFVAKNSEEIAKRGLKPFETIKTGPNALLYGTATAGEGIGNLIELLCTIGTPTAYSSTNARLGVGDSSAAPVASQIALQAATNKLWKGMNATYPQITGANFNQAVWQADFVDTEAEWALGWLEETVVNTATDAGDNLCRQNTNLGIKPAGQTWRLTATITFS